MRTATTGLALYMVLPLVFGSLALLLQACSEQAPPAAPEPAKPAAEEVMPAAASAAVESETDAGTDSAGYELVTTASTWFDVLKISETVYAIAEPGHVEHVISYLVIGKRQALLFDTGLGIGDIRSVVRSLTKLPLLVLNSHNHYEHIGGNHQFDTILARNTAFTKQQAQGLAHSIVGEFVSPARISRRLPPRFEAASYQVKPFEFSQWVNQGQLLDLGGIILEVLFTPGHSSESICLLDRENRLLFTGDTFYPGSLDLTLAGANFDHYSTTVTALAALSDQVDIVLPGHHTATVSGDYLAALAQAVQDIATGSAQHSVIAGKRQYSFDGFSILTGNSP